MSKHAPIPCPINRQGFPLVNPAAWEQICQLAAEAAKTATSQPSNDPETLRRVLEGLRGGKKVETS